MTVNVAWFMMGNNALMAVNGIYQLVNNSESYELVVNKIIDNTN